MSHIVSLSNIKQYLPNEKLGDIVHDDFSSLENNEFEFVVGKLSKVFDVTLWIGSDTPSIVKGIIAMRVASRIYARQYSEESADKGSYAAMLLSEADSLIENILGDELDIGEEPSSDLTITGEPDILETDPIFTMGEVF